MGPITLLFSGGSFTSVAMRITKKPSCILIFGMPPGDYILGGILLIDYGLYSYHTFIMQHGLRKLEQHPGTITRVGSMTLVNKEKGLDRGCRRYKSDKDLRNRRCLRKDHIWACGSANCNNATNLSRPGNRIDGAR